MTSVYDADNELTDTTDQDGRRTTYSYDKDGDQLAETGAGRRPTWPPTPSTPPAR